MLRFVLLFLTVIGIWAGFNLAVIAYIPSWQERGQFGDMFGAVNALFSALAFAAVASAIFIQRGQLDTQKRDLKLSAQLNAMAALGLPPISRTHSLA